MEVSLSIATQLLGMVVESMHIPAVTTQLVRMVVESPQDVPAV